LFCSPAAGAEKRAEIQILGFAPASLRKTGFAEVEKKKSIVRSEIGFY